MIALLAGIVLRLDRIELVGLVLNPFLLSSVFAANLIALLYRLVAIIDAYRVAEFMNAVRVSGDGRLGRARLPRQPLSVAGLLAVLLVMAGTPRGRRPLRHAGAGPVQQRLHLRRRQDRARVRRRHARRRRRRLGARRLGRLRRNPSRASSASAVPNVSIPPWDGKERLNVLLIGTDQRPKEGTYNTDTLIVVSIDPATKQVAMFSLPRDTVDVPVPPGPARQAFGPVYPKKINAWFTSVRNRADLFPGTDVTRGYNGLKAIIGNLYGLDIKYFVEVNFEGFKAVVDALGGVTDQRPDPGRRRPLSGRQRQPRADLHPERDPAHGRRPGAAVRPLHGTRRRDFDRGARQQRVLLSLREQADPQALIPRLPDLITALKKAVRTDVPVDQLDQLLGLASQVDTKDIRSYVFAPPLYGQEISNSPRGYIIEPDVAKIRAAVSTAFTANPADEVLREKLAEEAAHGLGPQQHRRRRPGVAPGGVSRVLRAGRVGTAARSRPAASAPTPRSWSTTARRPGWPARSPTSSRRSA